MAIDPQVSAVLDEVRVVEFSTVTKTGGTSTRPMAASWIPQTGQIVITTPLAYAAKVSNARRDSRVAVFYSDFTGSGLPDSAPAVLVQGTASVPDGVATPQDIPDYWRVLFRKTPTLVEEFASDEARATMDWYYWRLPIVITPDRVHAVERTPAGGALEPPAPWFGPLQERIDDALGRYPTAVLTALDATGHPSSARVALARQEGQDVLTVRPLQPFAGRPGPASLLWHRHNGQSGDMSSLHVAGTATISDRGWTFSPERIPGEPGAAASDTDAADADTGAADASTADGGYDAGEDDWIADARRRSELYLERRGLPRPTVDWDTLAACAPR